MLSRRLLNLARDSRLALSLTVLCGLAAGLLTIGQAGGISRMVDGVFLGGLGLQDLGGVLRLLLVIVFLRAILAWGLEVSSRAIALRIKNDLRRMLFDKLLRLGPAYTRGERTGELVNAAGEGVEALEAYFSQYLPQLIIAGLVPLSILVVVFPRDPLSGVVLLLTAPLIPVFMYLIGKSAEKLTSRQWETLSRLSAHFLDSLQGLRTLKELGRSREQAESIAKTSEQFSRVTMSVLRVTFLSALVLELVSTVSTAMVAVEVGLRLLYGQIQFQQAFFLLLLAPEFYIPLRMLGLRFHAGMAGTSAARRIFEILDAPEPSIKPDSIYETTAFPFSSVSMSGVSYIYPGESQPALRDISLQVRAGEHIALVGKSGAGKSTLLDLVMNFIQPTEGHIQVDGRDLSSLPPEDWRNMVAWVPQAPHLFHDTIAANLRLARPDASDEQVAEAARWAHLEDFIQSLPDGYQTLVGEDGTRLSAGQAQRLSLARAFLKNAPLLVMDEPTSSLDPEQEAFLEAGVKDLMQGRMVITLAHRLNTIFQADKIHVLEGGRMVEAGTHRELLAKGGTYASLVRASQQVDDSLRPLMKAAHFPAFEAPGIPPAPKPGRLVKSSTLLRLLGFLRCSWGWVALSVLAGVLTIGSNVGLMGTSAFLISAAALHPSLGSLQIPIVGVRFFGIARGIFRYSERLSTHHVTFRLLARLRSWFYRALEPLAPARLMQYRAGDLLARIISDVGTLEDFYVRVVGPFLVACLSAGGLTYFFSRYDAGMAMTYLAFLVALGVGSSLSSWASSRRAGKDLVIQRATLQARLVDGIQGLADLLAFSAADAYADTLDQQGRKVGRLQARLAHWNGFSNGLVSLVASLGLLTILTQAARLVAAGELPGVMLAALSLVAMAGFEAVMPLPQAAHTLASSLQAARRLFDVVDAPPAVVEMNGRYLELPRLAGGAGCDLRWENISFTYPGSVQPALQEISFHLPPGRRVALVGPSGAGKSTLASLLLRFWDYEHGRILLDGMDLHSLSPMEVRKRISVVSQRTYFFNASIRDNLLLANPGASEQEMIRVARQAQIHDFIRGLPRGYETVIGERGLRLSGGERQRLAAARALLKNAPIFLLDEPTANLDTLAERQLLEVLFAMRQGRSLLLITHRLVGLENMDEILVLQGGRLVERGNHPSLLASQGSYRRLWDIQNRLLVE